MVERTLSYVSRHLPVAERLNKPLVIEEFGLPRDDHSFDVKAPTTLRDAFYGEILSAVGKQMEAGGHLAGSNFWAFGGAARPVKGRLFWREGDSYTGDPPMEEQGLNTVFDSDESTWKVIRAFGKSAERAVRRAAR